MRSGRPGPVLIDLPVDVQLAEIEFDPETYQPLPVYKPAASRAQVEKALDMLAAARAAADRGGRRRHQRRRRRPAGGVRRADRRPGGAHADGLGRDRRRPPAQRGHGRPPDLHRYGNATLLASDFVLGIGNRWANRHTGGLDTYTRGPHLRARRHRADADRPGVRPRLRHRLRRQGGADPARRGGPRPRPARPLAVGGASARAQAHAAPQDQLRQRAGQAAAGLPGDEPRVRPGRALREHDRPVADPGGPVAARVPAAALDQRRAGRARSAGPSRPRSASPPPTPAPPSSRCPATTTSSS